MGENSKSTDEPAGDGPFRQQKIRHTTVRSALSWLPVVALVVLSFVFEASGHIGLSWATDPLAVAAWWFTRPLRR